MGSYFKRLAKKLLKAVLAAVVSVILNEFGEWASDNKARKEGLA